MPTEQQRFDQTYRDIRAKVNGQLGGGGAEKDEIFWAVIEGVSAVIDGVLGTKGVCSGPAAGVTGGSLRLIYDLIKGAGDEPGITPNPWFVWNGHDDGPTEYTRRYLKNRMYKGFGSSAIAITGAAVSFASQVDVGGILQNSNALGSTGVHLWKFKAIANSYKETKTISGWLNVIMKMKAIKAGIRTTSLVGSSVPVPAVGAVTGVLAAAAKLGAKLSLGKVCLATAADLHWRAFQEQVLTGALAARYGAGQGPAMRIMDELFSRRGATRVFGQYDVPRIIREPNGWLAIYDKLMLF